MGKEYGVPVIPVNHLEGHVMVRDVKDYINFFYLDCQIQSLIEITPGLTPVEIGWIASFEIPLCESSSDGKAYRDSFDERCRPTYHPWNDH